MAVVVAQLVERLLPTSEICGSNPVIGKFLFTIKCIKSYFEKTNVKKRGREWPI